MHVWRKDLEDYLSRFVAGHRGLRFGRMFGVPAAYAGRKLFSCAIDDGIVAKLPPDALTAALAKGAMRWAPRPPKLGAAGKATRAGWVMFRPKSAVAAEAIRPFLEIAARHVALDAGHTRS